MPSLFFSQFFSPRLDIAQKAEPSPANSSSQAPGQDRRSGRVVDIRQDSVQSPSGAVPVENGTIVENAAPRDVKDSPPVDQIYHHAAAVREEEERLESPVPPDQVSHTPVNYLRSTSAEPMTVPKDEGPAMSNDTLESVLPSRQDITKEDTERKGKKIVELDNPDMVGTRWRGDSTPYQVEDERGGLEWEYSESSSSVSAVDAVRNRELDKGKNIEIEEDGPAFSGNKVSRFGETFTGGSPSGSLLSQFLGKSSPKTSGPHTPEAFSAHTIQNQETFTSPESIPPGDVCFKDFLKHYPKYTETTDIDKLRKEHYAHLQDTGHVCLDYCGYGLFSHYQQVENKAFSSFGLAYISANLATHALYGAADEQTAEGCIRKRIMQYLNISDTEYSMVFTASRGSAFKLLAESYPFHVSGRLLTVYDHDSESVKWMVESARQRGAKVMSGLFKWPSLRICTTTLKKQIKGKWRSVPHKKKSSERWNKLFLTIFRKLTGVRKSRDAHFLERRRTKDTAKGLFVFPLQSRITGSKLAHQWMSYAQQNKWHVLLDASALGPKEMSSLGLSLFRPDFIVASFFKVFGADPTGFGCLFIKNSVMSYLQSSYRARGVGMVKLVPYGSSMSPVGSSQSTGRSNSEGLQESGVRSRQTAGGEGMGNVTRGPFAAGVSSFSGPFQAPHKKAAPEGHSGILSGNVYVGYNKDAYAGENAAASGTTFDSGNLSGSGSIPPSSTLYPSGSFYASSSVYPSGALLTPNNLHSSGTLHSDPWHDVGDPEKGRKNLLSEVSYASAITFSGPISPQMKGDRFHVNTLRESSLGSNSHGNGGPGKGNHNVLREKVLSIRGEEHSTPRRKEFDRARIENSTHDNAGSPGGEHSEQAVEGESSYTGFRHGSSSDRQSSEGIRKENNTLASSGHEIDGSSGGDSFATPQAELLDVRKDLGFGELVEGEVEGGHTSSQAQPHDAVAYKGQSRQTSDSNLHNLATEVTESLSRHMIVDGSLVRRSIWGSEEDRSYMEAGPMFYEDEGASSLQSRERLAGTLGTTATALLTSSNHGASLNGASRQIQSGGGTKRFEYSLPRMHSEQGSNLKESAFSRESEKAYELRGCRDQRRLLMINREIAEMDASSGDSYALMRDSLGSSNSALYNIQENSSGASERSDYTEVLEEDLEDSTGLPLPAVFCQSLDHADFMGLNRTNMRQRYLVDWLVQWLQKLEHPGGRRLIHLYGPKGRVDRGQSVAFNVFDWNGNLLQPGLVQRLADRSNIALGMGTLCNIDFPEDLSLVPGLIIKKKTGREGESSRPRIRVVTASLGFVTNFEDVYRVWHFLAKFLDVDFLFREVWRYHTLNQETVVLDESMAKGSSHA